MIRLLRARFCLSRSNLLRRHKVSCMIQANIDRTAPTMHHTHICIACKRLVHDETTPMPPETEALLNSLLDGLAPPAPIMGMGIDEQRSFLN